VNVVPTELDGVVELQPRRFEDARGWFAETYNAATFAELGIPAHFVQDNESFSEAVGTIRGIHYQLPPFAQTKIVRVVHGAVNDVVVDLREGSPTFARSVTVSMSAAVGNQLVVPVGFGHAFCTTEPDTVVAYKVDARYAPECERAVRWNDPTIAIDWSLDRDPVVSDKDAIAPLLADQPDLFAPDLGTESSR
jgi:dTDP-4-dehydrorhamnose 3,5-epimerase